MVEQNEVRTERYDTADNISDDIDIRELYMMFWRRKMTILAVLIAGISLSILTISTITPHYTAQSTMLFESDSKKVKPQDFLLPFNLDSVDFAFILTELEILKSRELARDVIEKLDLASDAEFSYGIQGTGAAASGRSSNVQPRFKSMTVATPDTAAQADKIDAKTSVVITRFLRKLKVSSVPGSTLVNVSFSSQDSYKAALIANTLADTYREQKRFKKYENRKELINWLESRLKETREQVFKIEVEIENFKTENNLTKGKKDWVSVEKLEELNRKLTLEQANYIDVKALVEQFDKQSSSDMAISSYSKIISVASIKAIQEEKRQLTSEISQLTNRYGPKHPELINRKTKLLELDKAMKAELKKSKRTLRNELEVVQGHIDEIEDQITEVAETFHGSSDALIKLQELERESESSKLVLNTLLGTYKRSASQDNTLEDIGVEVLSYASVPYETAYPNKPLMFSLSAFVSLSLGLIIAVLLEKMDNVFRRREQLEKIFNAPCHAAIPALKRIKKNDLAGYVLSNPSSVLAEAVRTLRMSLAIHDNADAKSQVVMFTSSVAGEDKKALALWLARLSAKAGEKVILIDADLRDPDMHKYLGDQNDTSLVDYLSGQKKLEEVVKKDDLTGMNVIYGQSVPNSAFDLISSKKMNTLIEALRGSYDLVVFNTPPSLEVPDSKALLKQVDHALYVVGCNKTPRDFVMNGMKYFYENAQGKLGIVLSNMR